jgi:hypothetical protein
VLEERDGVAVGYNDVTVVMALQSGGRTDLGTLFLLSVSINP